VNYQLLFRPAAFRELRGLPRAIQERIGGRIAALAERPRPAGVVKLAGRDNTYRIRIGEYRVLCEIHDTTVTVLVVAVRHRRDAYR
jgi:mRNA interferase RelE/StbE